MNYGHKLKVTLANSGKTQAWLARELGVSTGAVNHWVSGYAEVPPARQAEILGLLGLESVAQDYEDLADLIANGTTPLAFLLREVPVDAGGPLALGVGTQAHAEASLKAWAKCIGVTQQRLYNVAYGVEFLTMREIGAVFGTGVKLTYLGEHLGQSREERDIVIEWAKSLAGDLHAGRVEGTWSAVREALRLVDTTGGMLVGMDKQAGVHLVRDEFTEGERTGADDLYELTKEFA